MKKFLFIRLFFKVKLLFQLVKGHTYNIYRVPRNKRSRTVLTQYKSRHVLSVNTTQITQHLIKTCRIQQGSGSKNFICRIIELFLCNISENIERIRYNNNNCLPRISGNLLHNIVHNTDIFLQKHHPVS